MSIRSIHPYIRFDGRAEEAIAHYRKALGAEVEELMRWGEMPGDGVPKAHANRIMHAQLRLDGHAIMLADRLEPSSESKDDVQILLQCDDPSDMRARFDALARDGEITHPIEKAFWGDDFGMLTDVFGVRWMFVGSSPKQG